MSGRLQSDWRIITQADLAHRCFWVWHMGGLALVGGIVEVVSEVTLKVGEARKMGGCVYLTLSSAIMQISVICDWNFQIMIIPLIFNGF